jgi:hypothetical protein
LAKKAADTDILFLGSPIYFGEVTGEMRSFMERLFFPNLTYTDPPGTLCPRKIYTAAIYTMGAPQDLARERGFDRPALMNQAVLTMLFGGASEWLCSYDTLQFDDYSKVYAPRFDGSVKSPISALCCILRHCGVG